VEKRARILTRHYPWEALMKRDIRRGRLSKTPAHMEQDAEARDRRWKAAERLLRRREEIRQRTGTIDTEALIREVREQAS
jgi:hypothetical protein